MNNHQPLPSPLVVGTMVRVKIDAIEQSLRRRLFELPRPQRRGLIGIAEAEHATWAYEHLTVTIVGKEQEILHASRAAKRTGWPIPNLFARPPFAATIAVSATNTYMIDIKTTGMPLLSIHGEVASTCVAKSIIIMDQETTNIRLAVVVKSSTASLLSGGQLFDDCLAKGLMNLRQGEPSL